MLVSNARPDPREDRVQTATSEELYERGGRAYMWDDKGFCDLNDSSWQFVPSLDLYVRLRSDGTLPPISSRNAA